MMELWPNSSSIQEELDTTETSRLTGLSSDTSTSDSQVILIIILIIIMAEGHGKDLDSTSGHSTVLALM